MQVGGSTIFFCIQRAISTVVHQNPYLYIMECRNSVRHLSSLITWLNLRYRRPGDGGRRAKDLILGTEKILFRFVRFQSDQRDITRYTSNLDD